LQTRFEFAKKFFYKLIGISAKTKISGRISGGDFLAVKNQRQRQFLQRFLQINPEKLTLNHIFL
jgi:hypothetical protein